MQRSASVEWHQLLRGSERERALLKEERSSDQVAWRLDPTEGPNRVRLKLQRLPTSSGHDELATQRTGSVVSEAGTASFNQTAPDNELDSAKIGAGPSSASAGAQTSSHGLKLDIERLTLSKDAEAAGPTSGTSSIDIGTSEGGKSKSNHEDKFQYVLRSLERRDVIEAVFNTSRVVGIESRGCLLILGKLCVYLMDDYFQRPNGELINVWEAPPEERDALVVATLSSDASKPSDLIEQLEGETQMRKWPWSAVQICHRRSWLHRRTAVEIFFEGGQSYLLVCPETATAQKMYQELKMRAPSAVAAAELMREGIRERTASASPGQSASLGSHFAGAVFGRSAACGSITAAWRKGKLSNFSYLMELNTLAGRSMNDLTQYPCFPWVLADYVSGELDLNDPATFRNFELPMGAQSPHRRKDFEDRYVQLQEVDEEPFHYGTHYSTASTVCGYLVRTRPFERLLKALQGGNFDLADRTFGSIGKAWMSASELSRGDVRELIPEFFYLPEFLRNSNRFDFGVTQAGEMIDDVELPPWAKGDPRLFILKHREALECEYVSQRLHHWIDLVFGFRSRGKEAVQSTNVFHPLSYEDAVDLDSIDSAMERQATAQMIHNFGQTPSRLFQQPHPQRLPRSKPPLPPSERFGLLEHPRLIIQNFAPIRTLKDAVHFIYPFPPERAFASPKDYLILPKLGVSLSIEPSLGSLRMHIAKDAKRAMSVTEQVTPSHITCMAPARLNSFVAGSSDGVVSLWSLNVGKKRMKLSKLFRGHDAAVLCVTASSAWSIIVSGSEDQTSIIWDLNRGEHVRSLRNHHAGVHLVSIDEKLGYIATASGSEVHLWSINGDLLSCLTTGTNPGEPIASLGFLERDYHVDRLAVVLTGHRGKVIAWEAISDHDSFRPPHHSKGSGSGIGSGSVIRGDGGDGGDAKQKDMVWKLAPLHVFEHHDRSGEVTNPRITAISSTSRVLLTGDELGRLYLWTLAGEAVAVADSSSSRSNRCANSGCNKKFGLLTESKRTCAGCGGSFCNACTAPHPQMGPASSHQRFCAVCHAIIYGSGCFSE